MGMFAHAVDFTDIATGWTEQRAVWGKGEKGVLEQIKDVEKMFTFELRNIIEKKLKKILLLSVTFIYEAIGLYEQKRMIL